MAAAYLSDFFRRLTRGMAGQTLGELSDRQLVERALAGRDEAAFQAIVHRHGAMVYRVCWRVLQDGPDAEDAFQAAFLVLAQRLRSVRKQASLASWLHGVAHRVALKAKARSATRRRHEAKAPRAETMPPDDVTWKELRSALDTEMDALPDKWRLPLILCYLEGRTQDEAAGQLGWSKSTLRRRLEEARAALGRRLNERGIVWPAALAAVLLGDCVVSAAPAPGLVAATVVAAADVAAGKTLASAGSASAAVLAEGVLKAMCVSKFKTAMVVLLVLLVGSLLPFGGALLRSQSAEGQEGQAKQEGAGPKKGEGEAKPPAAKPKPPPIAVIVKADLYEVDEAVYKRLSNAKRLSKEEWEKLERIFLGLDPPPAKKPGTGSLFDFLEKQKPIQAAKELTLDIGKEGALLSSHKTIKCLPSPEQLKMGDKGPQTIQEGVWVIGSFQLSWDKRYVRAKFTEKSAEIEGIEKVKVVHDDNEKEAEIAFLKESAHSQMRDIPDGGFFLLPLQYRPRAAKDRGRWLIVKITPRIYIEAEEERIRKDALSQN